MGREDFAVRATAACIALDLANPVGRAVGYGNGFGDRVSPDSFIRPMTDGCRRIGRGWTGARHGQPTGTLAARRRERISAVAVVVGITLRYDCEQIYS